MGGRAIELILAKQLASSLAVPVLLYDREGTVAFFNEPAEIFLGARLDQADALSTQDVRDTLQITTLEGVEPKPDERMVELAMREGRASHGSYRVRKPDGVLCEVDATAVPLIGQSGDNVGTLVFFWERASS